MKGQTSTSALKRFMNKDNTVGHVFAFPFIFGFVCFSLIPVCISFYYAFTNYSLGSKTAAFIGFKNFLRLFQDEVCPQRSVQQRAGQHGHEHHQLVRQPETGALPADFDVRLAVWLFDDYFCRWLKRNPCQLL